MRVSKVRNSPRIVLKSTLEQSELNYDEVLKTDINSDGFADKYIVTDELDGENSNGEQRIFADEITEAEEFLFTPETDTVSTDVVSIENVEAGIMDAGNGRTPDMKMYGTTFVNLLGIDGKSVVVGGEVSFDSVLDNVYFDRLHGVKITGTGSPITITNDTGAIADIFVMDLTAAGQLDVVRTAKYGKTSWVQLTEEELEESTPEYVHGVSSVNFSLEDGPVDFGNALSLDGTGDYVAINETSEDSLSVAIPTQQGITTDGTYLYITDAAKLYKYTIAGVYVGESDTETLHMGGLCYHDGLLYVAQSECLTTPSVNQFITVFNTDLEKINSVDVSEYFPICCGAICNYDGHFYMAESFWDSENYDRIVEFDENLNFVELHTTSVKSTLGIQGIEYIAWLGKFLIMSHGKNAYYIDTDFSDDSIQTVSFVFNLQDVCAYNGTLYMNNRDAQTVEVNPKPTIHSLLNDEATFEAWIYVDSSGNGIRRTIFETNDRWALFCEINTSNCLTISVAPDGVEIGIPGEYLYCAVVYIADTFSTDSWHHIAFSVKLNEFLQVYIDGVQQSVVASSPYQLVPLGESFYPFSGCNIGTYRTKNSRWFNGNIDEVRLWNVARTKEQIQEYMNKKLDPETEGLIGYWTFDEASGNVLDNSGYHYDGVLQADATRVVSGVVGNLPILEEVSELTIENRGSSVDNSPVGSITVPDSVELHGYNGVFNTIDGAGNYVKNWDREDKTTDAAGAFSLTGYASGSKVICRNKTNGEVEVLDAAASVTTSWTEESIEILYQLEVPTLTSESLTGSIKLYQGQNNILSPDSSVPVAINVVNLNNDVTTSNNIVNIDNIINTASYEWNAGNLTSWSMSGRSFVNLLHDSEEVPDDYSRHFKSLDGNTYFDYLNATIITGDNTYTFVTNSSGDTASMAVYNLTDLGTLTALEADAANTLAEEVLYDTDTLWEDLPEAILTEMLPPYIAQYTKEYTTSYIKPISNTVEHHEIPIDLPLLGLNSYKNVINSDGTGTEYAKISDLSEGSFIYLDEVDDIDYVEIELDYDLSQELEIPEIGVCWDYSSDVSTLTRRVLDTAVEVVWDYSSDVSTLSRRAI